MDKKHQKRLNAFMELKALKIEELTKIPREKYWNGKDTHDLISLPDVKAETIWHDLCRRIHEGTKGLEMLVCVPCLIDENSTLDECVGCDYSQNHGVCSIDGSDYKKIINVIGREYQFKKLDSAFYKDIIKQILDKERKNIPEKQNSLYIK